MKYLKARVNKLLAKYDYIITRRSVLYELKRSNIYHKFGFHYGERIFERFVTYVQFSKSQLKQDLFVLSEFNFKRNGFFVEFGATDGYHLSNTWLLENEFGWKGILAEPALCWHKDLHLNRKVIIDKRFVWAESKKSLHFKETKYAELSTLSVIDEVDEHIDSRREYNSYYVETVSLEDLLCSNNAPNEIDYLSIDTEGSEYTILENFNFEKYKIKIITVEHNYTANREKIYDLLISKGYKRKLEALSQFDDWYILEK